MEIKPIDDFLRFGELNPDGTVKRDVKVCAVTGAVIEPGDAMIKIEGTSRFYRVKAPLLWPQNRESFEAIRPELEARVKPLPLISAPDVPAEPSANLDVPAGDTTLTRTPKISKGGV